jgi:hypothetical protein
VWQEAQVSGSAPIDVEDHQSEAAESVVSEKEVKVVQEDEW